MAELGGVSKRRLERAMTAGASPSVGLLTATLLQSIVHAEPRIRKIEISVVGHSTRT
jgi:hypothetical protein